MGQRSSCIKVRGQKGLSRLTRLMRSLARSRARSGEVKHASPAMATPASYWPTLFMSYRVQGWWGRGCVGVRMGVGFGGC